MVGRVVCFSNKHTLSNTPLLFRNHVKVQRCIPDACVLFSQLIRFEVDRLTRPLAGRKLPGIAEKVELVT